MKALALLAFVVACRPSTPDISCGPGTQLQGQRCLAIDAAPSAPAAALPAPSTSPAPHEPTPGLALQVTHAVTIDPAISPDGKHMVYITVVADKEQLFVADLDGAHVRQLTRDDADHEDPTWSAANKIAYVHIVHKASVIHWMDADGTGDEALTPAGQRAIHPSFSADGTVLAYCLDDDLAPPAKNDSDIYTLALATKQLVKRITGGVNTYPVFSPDGKRLAFRRMTDATNSEVFVANLDGSNAKNLTNSPAFDGWPAWSPDGAWIAFASNRKFNYQIYVMRADGTDVRLVAPTEGRATAPKWDPDGKHIYFPDCRKVDFTYDCQIYVARSPT